VVDCKHGWQCTCVTCTKTDCEDQPRICDECNGTATDVLLYCSIGKAHGAKEGVAKKIEASESAPSS